MISGQHMATIPVCISILASFLPSTSFIGFPVVVYATGTQFWVVVVPAVISAVVACELFLPIYYKMNLISVNQYLHKRFKSHNLQIIGNISTLLSYVRLFCFGIIQNSNSYPFLEDTVLWSRNVSHFTTDSTFYIIFSIG